jgi:hypothetical protein
MKTNTVSFSVSGILVIAALLVIGSLKIQQAHAQVDATSSDIVATSSDSTNRITDAIAPLVLGESTSTAPSADAAPSSTESTPADTSPSAAATPSVSVVPTETPPGGLTLVHIMGTKYIDYFTDGTTITSLRGTILPANTSMTPQAATSRSVTMPLNRMDLISKIRRLL